MKSWSSILCALCLFVIASPSLAQQRQHSAGPQAKPAETKAGQSERDKQARVQFEEGRKAFDQGDYRAAWSYFHEAFRLSGRAQLLFNIGQTADRLGRDSDALTAFRMYLERLPEADNRRDVENRIRALEERVRESERVPGPPGSAVAAGEVAAPQPTAAEAAGQPEAQAAAASDVAAASQPPPAAPRSRPTRKGLYLRLGLGVGFRSDAVSGDAEGVLTGGGLAGELAIGGTLFPGFVLGGALFTDLSSSPTFESESGVKSDLSSANLSMLGPMIDWYTSPESIGFHLQAALTFAFVSIDYKSAGVSIGRNASGVGAMIGAGYEWAVAEEWAIGVLARVGFAALADDSLGHGMFAPSLLATVTWY